MRTFLSVLALAAAVPSAAPSQEPQPEAAGVFHLEPYRTIRPSELRVAAFLTEMRTMPFGQVLGPVSLPAVSGTQSPEMATLGATIGVRPPLGVAYQRGDTVLLAVVVPGPKGWGEMVLPTGLARVENSNPRQTEAVVVAFYGPIRAGQVTLPISPLPSVGTAQPTKVEGPTGFSLFGREPGSLYQLGSEIFVDLGTAQGMRLGDFIQFRRRAGLRPNEADLIDEELAVGQVVNVGEKSSTVRLFRIKDPNIPAGSPVLRVATLSN